MAEKQPCINRIAAVDIAGEGVCIRHIADAAACQKMAEKKPCVRHIAAVATGVAEYQEIAEKQPCIYRIASAAAEY